MPPLPQLGLWDAIATRWLRGGTNTPTFSFNVSLCFFPLSLYNSNIDTQRVYSLGEPDPKKKAVYQSLTTARFLMASAGMTYESLLFLSRLLHFPQNVSAHHVSFSLCDGSQRERWRDGGREHKHGLID